MVGTVRLTKSMPAVYWVRVCADVDHSVFSVLWPARVNYGSLRSQVPIGNLSFQWESSVCKQAIYHEPYKDILTPMYISTPASLHTVGHHPTCFRSLFMDATLAFCTQTKKTSGGHDTINGLPVVSILFACIYQTSSCIWPLSFTGNFIFDIRNSPHISTDECLKELFKVWVEKLKYTLSYSTKTKLTHHFCWVKSLTYKK